MATHHVDLRGACPAPAGQLTPSPGEFYLNEPDSSGARLSTERSYFYPSERLSLERANTIELGRCIVSHLSFSRMREEVVMHQKMRGPVGPPSFHH
jgi:hypothetical protein